MTHAARQALRGVTRLTIIPLAVLIWWPVLFFIGEAVRAVL